MADLLTPEEEKSIVKIWETLDDLRDQLQRKRVNAFAMSLISLLQ
jgi:hypothetical protein